jgi:AcrR family transcriptional regulator
MAPRDAEATKARIFEAATAEFAAHGIAGARVDRIAQTAQANKQLIYAYFGDKQKLFYRVLDKTLVEVAESVSTDITDLDKWVDEHVDYHRQHPELLRLLMWEALEVPKEQTCRSEARAERYGVKKEKIAEAQEQGLEWPRAGGAAAPGHAFGECGAPLLCRFSGLASTLLSHRRLTACLGSIGFSSRPSTERVDGPQ